MVDWLPEMCTAIVVSILGALSCCVSNNCSEFKLIPVTGIGAMAGIISAHIFLPTPALTIGTYFAHVMSNNVLSDGMR